MNGKGLDRVTIKVGGSDYVSPHPSTATAARVIDRFEEGEDGEGDLLAVGNIRKLASASLLDTDKRYSGKTISRKALKEDQWEHPLSGSSGKWIYLHVFCFFLGGGVVCLFFAWYSSSFFPNFLRLRFPLSPF